MGWRRLGLMFLAVVAALLGFAYAHIADTANLDAFLPGVWALVFVAVGVLLFAFALHPARWLWNVTGPLAVVGLLSRPSAVAINYVAGFTRSGWSVVAATIVYSALAWFVWDWWTRHVNAWMVRQQAGATVPGD